TRYFTAFFWNLRERHFSAPRGSIAPLTRSCLLGCFSGMESRSKDRLADSGFSIDAARSDRFLIWGKSPDSSFSTGMVIRWGRIGCGEGERQTPASREPG